MDSGDEGLFGRDMCHRPPLTILPAVRTGMRCARYRQKMISELWPLADLLDAAAILGSDYTIPSSCGRFVLPTWSYGRVEVDLFTDVMLILPEEEYRKDVCMKLERLFVTYDVVGELQFIRIKRKGLWQGKGIYL